MAAAPPFLRPARTPFTFGARADTACVWTGDILDGCSGTSLTVRGHADADKEAPHALAGAVDDVAQTGVRGVGAAGGRELCRVVSAVRDQSPDRLRPGAALSGAGGGGAGRALAATPHDADPHRAGDGGRSAGGPRCPPE